MPSRGAPAPPARAARGVPREEALSVPTPLVGLASSSTQVSVIFRRKNGFGNMASAFSKIFVTNTGPKVSLNAASDSEWLSTMTSVAFWSSSGMSTVFCEAL